MRRFFNHREKQILFTTAQGVCSICGTELEQGWHADHIQPFSRNGATDLDNGQALCKTCNLKKTNKIMLRQSLRPWQDQFIKLLNHYRKQGEKSFLLNAGVGSGKTYASVVASLDFIKDGYDILIVSPSCNIKERWAVEYLNFSIDINYKYNCNYNYKNNYKGASITYHILKYKENVEFLIRNNIVSEKTLIILDEVHHTGSDMSWGEAIKKIGDKAGFVLSLSGTPTRSDDRPIPFVKYEPHTEDGKYILKPDYVYSYGQSVRDKICCPISFRSFDIKAYGIDGMIPENRTDIMKSAISVKENSTVYEMFLQADKNLSELQNYFHDAGGLVVCATIEDATLLYEKIGSDISVLVTSDDDDDDESRAKITEFNESNKKWIISVRMISEGVDIPRLRNIVFATNITTPLFFQQVAGRGVRNRNDEKLGTIDHCYFFYFNYEPLVRNAKQIEDEISHIIEVQEQEIKEYNEIKQYELSGINDIVFETELGDYTIHNNGVDLKDFMDIKYKLTHSEWAAFERKLAQKLKVESSNVYANDKKPLLKDRITKISNDNHELVKRIKNISAYKNDVNGYAVLHSKYNIMSNIITDADKENLTKQLQKNEYLKREYKRLINGQRIS